MYIKRKIEGKILKYIDSPEIIAIVGPRQCGKTTLLLRAFQSLRTGAGEFISFEDQKILGMFENNLDDFIGIYVKGKEYLFIDEFQYAKNGGKKLKYIFDLHKIKIFISGSSAIDLTVNALKFLVGRIFIFNLYPLDFGEFLDYKDRKYSEQLENCRQSFGNSMPSKIGGEIHDKLSKYYEEYVLFGGYPRVVLADSAEEKKEVLRNIYNTYFLREVRDILGLIDDYKLSKLIKALAFQIGNLIEYKELSLVSEYAYPTLKKYLNFLEKTFICDFVKPYFKNKRIEIVKNPKVYFLDTGLRNLIVNDFRGLNDRPDAGALLENAVFQQIIKNGWQANYWRSKKQYEMDFVLFLENRVELALEVKNYLNKTASASLSNFKATHPDIKINFIYRNIDPKVDAKNVLTFPVYAI